MGYLIEKIREFGKRYGFIPQTKENISDDFGYVDPEIKDIAYQVKKEIDDYYASKEQVKPFHWHNVQVKTKSMPSRLQYVVNWGKKILKKVEGYLGYYTRNSKEVYINKHLLDYDNPATLRYVIKHELMHSLQDELDVLKSEPQWKYEAEASIFAAKDFENLDFERTRQLIGYRPWTMKYIRQFGKKLMTSFKDRIKKIKKYFTEGELE